MIVSVADWRHVAEALSAAGKPWPTELRALDWRWWLEAVAAGEERRLPGRPELIRRWGATDHEAKTWIARHTPAGRQPVASPATVRGGESGENHQRFTSGSPADRQITSWPGGGSPADRQPTASPATVRGGESGENRQPVATGAPAAGQSPLMNADPKDLSKDDRMIHRSGGSGGDRLHTPSGAPMTAEQRLFLELYCRWADDPAAPHRWQTPRGEALEWFTAEILGQPLDGVDVIDTLRRLGDWLTEAARNFGKPGTKGGPRFPSNWKSTFRTSFGNARTYASKQPNQGVNHARRGNPRAGGRAIEPTRGGGGNDDGNW